MATANANTPQQQKPVRASVGDDGIWYLIGFVVCLFLVWPITGCLNAIRSAFTVNAKRKSQEVAAANTSSSQPTPKPASSAAHEQAQSKPVAGTIKAAELKVPNRAADVIRTGEVSNAQTLRIFFYFGEDVIAQTLITREGKDVGRKTLPLERVNPLLTESAHVKMLVDRLKGDDMPPVMYAAEEVAAAEPLATVSELLELSEPEPIPYEDDGAGGEAMPAVTANVRPIRPARKKNFQPSGGTEPIRVYEGKYLRSGEFPRNGNNGPYNHFGIEVQDRNGVSECAYGVDLMRCIKESGAEEGDLVRIELLRSSPVASGQGEQARGKNIWKMRVLQSARS